MTGNAPNNNTNTAACDATTTSATAIISDINDTISKKTLPRSTELTVLFHFWAIFYTFAILHLCSFLPPILCAHLLFHAVVFQNIHRVAMD